MASQTNKDFLQTIIKESASSFSSEIVDPITFATSSWGLNFSLMPMQRFIIKVFYGMELDDKTRYIPINDMFNEKELYKFTEKECLKYLIEEGRTNIKDIDGWMNNKYSEMDLCMGRRSSKSVIASIVANFELYKLDKKDNPQAYYGFPEGQEICITCIATDNGQAGNLFDMIRSRALNCKFMASNIVGNSQTSMSLQTDNDIRLYGKNGKATLKVLTGGCSANGLRGRNNIVVILDEAAFFIDNDGRYSGDAVYDAVTPSVASFTKYGETTNGDGKVIMLSSPYKKAGIFWDSCNNAMSNPSSTLFFKMYSAMVNPTIDSAYLRKQYRRSKSSFMCEYGAEFSDNTTSWIDDYESFEKCIDKSRVSNPPSGTAGVDYFMGIDLGLKNDATAITIVHKENSTIVLDRCDVLFSGESDVWQFENSIYRNCTEMAGYDTIPLSAIVEKIRELCKWFPIKAGTFDQWAAGFALQEMLGSDLDMIQMKVYSQGQMAEIWNMLQSLYNEQMLRLWNHPVLIPELKFLECDRSSRNIHVQAPQREGYHDDTSFSFAIACNLCHQFTAGDMYSKATSRGVSQNYSGISGYKRYRDMQAHNHGSVLSRDVSGTIRNRFSLWR